MNKRYAQFLILALALLTSVNCASLGQKWKALVSGQPESTNYQRDASQPPPTSFAAQPNMMVGKDRKYKRVTKDNFSDGEELEEGSGSLWRKEGQGSYLFSQNNLRTIGDIINVEMEGKAADNLTAKLNTIKTNLARLDAPPVIRAPAAATGRPGVPRPDSAAKDQAANGVTPNVGQTASGAQPNSLENSNAAANAASSETRFDNVPCRIVEKNPDGSYRVKGQTSVYVGRREYRLIVTGIIRPDDVNTESVTSSKIIDGKFDLVASNKDFNNAASR